MNLWGSQRSEFKHFKNAEHDHGNQSKLNTQWRRNFGVFFHRSRRAWLGIELDRYGDGIGKTDFEEKRLRAVFDSLHCKVVYMVYVDIDKT